MSYKVEHVRVTLECDCCGLVEKQEAKPEQEQVVLKYWGSISVGSISFFACPACNAQVLAIIGKKEREEKEAKEKLVLHYKT